MGELAPQFTDALPEAKQTDSLLEQAIEGDESALQELFAKHTDRLKRMVNLRLDRRLRDQVDEDDVLHEAYLDASRRLAEYQSGSHLPFFLWLRHMVGEKLAEIHHQHLETQKRSAELEVSLHHGALPETTMSMPAQMMGALTSSPAAANAETRVIVQDALNALHDVDREMLLLKHLERLSTSEIGQLLGLSQSEVGTRYLRAIKCFRQMLYQVSGCEGI